MKRYAWDERGSLGEVHFTGMQASSLEAHPTSPAWTRMNRKNRRLEQLAERSCGEIEVELIVPEDLDLRDLPEHLSSVDALTLVALMERFIAEGSGQQPQL